MYHSILEFLNYGIILIFGIYLSAAFLGIQMKCRNILVLLGFSAVVGVLNILFFVLFDFKFTEQIYPLIIHLPLILFLTFFYKYQLIPSAISVFIAYLCCQMSNWAGLLFLNMTHLEWVSYMVRIITNVVVFLLLLRFLASAAAQLLQKNTKDIMIFGLMPVAYYLYDYSMTVYTALFYSGSEVIAELLGFMLCVFYVLFLLIYFKQYEEKKETEKRNQLMEMQRIQSQKELEMMKSSQYAISLLCHDMRHFLNDIAGFIENGESERAKQYISEVIATVDKSALKKYCSNKIVNMILTSYEKTILEYGIDFQHSVRIPEELGFSDCDISSILSNGLENAVHAVSFLEQDKRKIELDLHMNNGKFLISIKNTYAERPKMVEGLPQAKESGHGLGTESIRYITEKLNGNCQFTVDEQYFILRIVL